MTASESIFSNDFITIYVSGAVIPISKIGGWAYFIHSQGMYYIRAGFEQNCRNSRAELYAVINSLEGFATPTHIRLITDSQYVKRAFTEGWIEDWVKNSWKKPSGGFVLNADLWRKLYKLTHRHRIDWNWISSRTPDQYNNLCNIYARNVAKSREESSICSSTTEELFTKALSLEFAPSKFEIPGYQCPQSVVVSNWDAARVDYVSQKKQAARALPKGAKNYNTPRKIVRKKSDVEYVTL